MLAPLILLRQCALRAESLERLNANNALDLWRRADAIDMSRQEVSASLRDELYEYCDTADAVDRHAVMRARRAIFKGLTIRDDDLKRLGGIVPPSLRDKLAAWTDTFRQQATLRGEAAHSYSACLGHARATIAELAASPRYLEGLQLSGRRLPGQALSYCHAVQQGERLSKAQRQNEDRLVSFLYRMALKPSPYASFTDILICPLDPHLVNDEALVRSVRLSRDLVQWLEWLACIRVEALRDELPLAVNDTLVERDGKFEAYVRAPDGSHEMLIRESFVSVAATAALTSLIGQLRALPVSRKQIVQSLVKQGHSSDNVASYIEHLIAKGLLIRNFGIPDQAGNYCQEAVKRLKGIADLQVDKIRATFNTLALLETSFAGADHMVRGEKIEQFQAEAKSLATGLGIDDPGLETLRSFFYEDVGRVTRLEAGIATALESNCPYLVRLSRLLSLFDGYNLERLALYEFAQEQFGNAANGPLDLVSLYKLFAQRGSNAMHMIMTANENANARQLLDIKKRFFEQLSAAIEAGDGEPIQLKGGWLDAFIDELPEMLTEWVSASYFVQPSAPDGTGVWVLNDAASGHGTAMSRFLSLAEERNPAVIARFSDYLRKLRPARRKLELQSVLGVNTNLHPKLYESEVVYPGCRASSDNVASLRDFIVTMDHGHKRLGLADRKTGQAVDLISLNFLFPAAGPTLYRFLHLFTPFIHFSNGHLLEYFQRFGDEKMHVMPRLLYGNVALNRRSWSIPASSFPALSSSPLALSSLAEVDRWRQQLDLPVRAFFRESPSGLRVRTTSPERSALELKRGRLRKPHFVDFRNPFLVGIFIKHTSQMQNSLIIQECLPEPPENDATTSEFLVQVDKPDAGASQ